MQNKLLFLHTCSSVIARAGSAGNSLRRLKFKFGLSSPGGAVASWLVRLSSDRTVQVQAWPGHSVVFLDT